MQEIVSKKEVEELLKCKITDKQFHEAYMYAQKKQAYIYEQEPREVVMQHWYLVKLTEEYVRSLALSKFTMDLCRAHKQIEKRASHPVTIKQCKFNRTGRNTTPNPIVACFDK